MSVYSVFRAGRSPGQNRHIACLPRPQQPTPSPLLLLFLPLANHEIDHLRHRCHHRVLCLRQRPSLVSAALAVPLPVLTASSTPIVAPVKRRLKPSVLTASVSRVLVVYPSRRPVLLDERFNFSWRGEQCGGRGIQWSRSIVREVRRS